MGYGDPQILDLGAQVLDMKAAEERAEQEAQWRYEEQLNAIINQKAMQDSALKQAFKLDSIGGVRTERLDSARRQGDRYLDSIGGARTEKLANQQLEYKKESDSARIAFENRMDSLRAVLEREKMHSDSARSAEDRKLQRLFHKSDSAGRRYTDSTSQQLQRDILASDEERDSAEAVLKMKIAGMDSAYKADALEQSERESKRDSSFKVDALKQADSLNARDLRFKKSQQKQARDFQMMNQASMTANTIVASNQAKANDIASRLQSFRNAYDKVNSDWYPNPSKRVSQSGQFFSEIGLIHLDTGDMIDGLNRVLPHLQIDVRSALFLPKTDERRKQVKEMIDKFVARASDKSFLKGDFMGGFMEGWGVGPEEGILGSADDAKAVLSELKALQTRLNSDDTPEEIYGITKEDMSFYNKNIQHGTDPQVRVLNAMLKYFEADTDTSGAKK